MFVLNHCHLPLLPCTIMPLWFPHSSRCQRLFPPLWFAATQVNSNADFANFEAFGNSGVPSHFSTSPPSQSFASGTPGSHSHTYPLIYIIYVPSPTGAQHVILFLCVSVHVHCHMCILTPVCVSLALCRARCPSAVSGWCCTGPVPAGHLGRGPLRCSGWAGQRAELLCPYRE